MSAPQLATLASWGGRFRLLAVPCTRNEPLKARLGRLRCGRAAGPRASILLLSHTQALLDHLLFGGPLNLPIAASAATLILSIVNYSESP